MLKEGEDPSQAIVVAVDRRERKGTMMFRSYAAGRWITCRGKNFLWAGPLPRPPVPAEEPDTRGEPATAEEYGEIRREMGLSRSALSRELGVDYKTVQRREDGLTDLRREMFLALEALHARKSVRTGDAEHDIGKPYRHEDR